MKNKNTNNNFYELLTSQTLNRIIKNYYRKKKAKNNGTYNTFHEPLSQDWIDGRY